MSRRPDGWIGWTTTGCVALLAMIAGTVSYLHMHQLVAGHGQPGWVAVLTPLSVDGMIVAASTALLADSRSGGRGGLLPWALLVTGSAASLAANVAVAEPTATGRVIAAWPSFALIGSYELADAPGPPLPGQHCREQAGSAAPQGDESGQSCGPSAAPLRCRRCAPSGWRRRGAATAGVAVGSGSPGCCYPDRTGDLRSVTKISDFYSARQLHSTGFYSGYSRPVGLEHHLMLCLPAGPPRPPGPGRSIGLMFFRGPGPDFSERDRALLMLLRPHLHQAYLDAERRRRDTPQLTPRHWELLRLVADGHTNAQIGRRLGVTEKTVGKHLENIYTRLQVSSRTAAVTRAFPDGAAEAAPAPGAGAS